MVRILIYSQVMSLRNRGGSASSKKTFKPNLAVAGIKETIELVIDLVLVICHLFRSNGNTRGGARGRRRGGGGGVRGGGGRGQGASKHQALIESQGIFSSGLGDQQDRRKSGLFVCMFWL